MGWLYGWETRAQVVSHLLGDRNFDVLTSKSTACGGRLWVVLEPTYESRERDEPFIALFLISKSDGLWGYKDMCESTGPGYYDCPLALLELAPVKDPEWREAVRAEAARRKTTFTKGDRVLIYGCEYEVLAPNKRSYHLYKVMDDGSLGSRLYRSTPAKMRLKADAERAACMTSAPY